MPLPNCTQLAYYFEQAGIGIGREETYRIYLALKQLVFNYQLSSIRFWGKTQEVHIYIFLDYIHFFVFKDLSREI